MKITIKPAGDAPEITIHNVARLRDMTDADEESVMEIDLGEDLEHPRFDRSVYVNPDNIVAIIIDSEE